MAKQNRSLPSQNAIAIGKRIAERRLVLEMSQAHLADLVGITKGAIGQYEVGLSTPRPDKLPILAAVLGVSIQWLLTGNEETPMGVSQPKLDVVIPEIMSRSSYFDPRTHRMVMEQRWFGDFSLGERFVLPSRTMGEGVFTAFQAASGDNHPVHYDVEYCRAHGMPGMLAHGYQVLIQTAAGAGLFPFLVEEALMGFLEQSSKFLAPVFCGDTVYPALEVDEVTPSRTTGVVGLASSVHNQRGVLVMEGRQRYLLRMRPV